MADLTVTVPDPQVDRIRQAYADNYDVDVNDVTAEDIRQFLIESLKNLVRAGEHKAFEEGFSYTPPDAT